MKLFYICFVKNQYKQSKKNAMKKRKLSDYCITSFQTIWNERKSFLFNYKFKKEITPRNLQFIDIIVEEIILDEKQYFSLN